MKRRFVGLAAVALALGVAVLLYRGPGRAIVRGHVGDVAATMLVYALISLVSKARVGYRAAGTLATATAIEIGQAWWHVESSPTAEVILGTTFDPWDLVAYVIGVIIALGWERTVIRRQVGRA